ncbi:MAG: DUF2934 domain-containing protein, partial [Gallionellaceae bacterium]|nr:DUF2934 domain-containing protein [Gallionellaceae bacterium]
AEILHTFAERKGYLMVTSRTTSSKKAATGTTEKKPAAKKASPATASASKAATAKTPAKKAAPKTATVKTAAKKPTAKTGTAAVPARKPVAAKRSKPQPAVNAAFNVKLGNISIQKTAVSPEERYQMIAAAAYLRAEQRNFEPGGALDDWIAAEAEVDARLNS